DTVWATIEPEAERHLEMSKLVSKPGEPEKPLFPLVFCRQCGTAYYRVSLRTHDGGQALLPREDRHEVGDDGHRDAYLYLSEAAPCAKGVRSELLERFPACMKERTPAGVERVRPDSRGALPLCVHVDHGGRLVSEGQGVPAALIRNSFLFC